MTKGFAFPGTLYRNFFILAIAISTAGFAMDPELDSRKPGVGPDPNPANLLSSSHHPSADPIEIVNGNIKLTFTLTSKGIPSYTVDFNGKPVIAPSNLGFTLLNNTEFSENFELLSSERSSTIDTWQPVWGETKNILNKYEQLTLHLKHTKDERLLNIIFRVFSDGIGFRYDFPQQDKLQYFIVSDELTQFTFTADHKTFWIPGDYDSNEYPYTTSHISQIDNKEIVERTSDIAVRTAPDRYSVQTPLMMKTESGVYINVHEAALRNYPAMQLHTDREKLRFTSSLVPDAVGNKAYLSAPCQTPWRTIIIAATAPEILMSKMILNLNEPSAIKNTSWIKPMKFVGVWWEMQTGVGTWSYAANAFAKDSKGKLIPSGQHSANTENVKRYIDFASANGIQGVLVEGWNSGWEDWFGNWKEEVFDFVTPYPDYHVKVLTDYAAARGVQLIMHNETSGSATNYERQLDTAFRFMKKFGYKSVKTGYVGKIIPRGEHHDGQWMVNHLNRVAEKAAGYQIMIDVHESMRPTGMHRTYPNWLANEAGRGNEFNAFSVGSPPEHETILPFTRLIGGPMDYTPGIFKLRNYNKDSTRRIHTTLAKQLALYVTIYSPIQMAADLPQNYEKHKDAFKFIRDVPVDWDETVILAAEPGDYISIARKGKKSDNWFIGVVTDENGRELTADLSFLDEGKKYKATIYGDKEGSDWQSNPEAYVITSVEVDRTTILPLKLAAGGGVAISIMTLNKKAVGKTALKK